MPDEKELYKAYKKFYRLGYFNWMKGLTGKPEYDLNIAKGLLKVLCLEAFLAIFRPLLQEAKRKDKGR